jgi:hypothetical protein
LKFWAIFFNEVAHALHVLTPAEGGARGCRSLFKAFVRHYLFQRCLADVEVAKKMANS